MFLFTTVYCYCQQSVSSEDRPIKTDAWVTHEVERKPVNRSVADMRRSILRGRKRDSYAEDSDNSEVGLALVLVMCLFAYFCVCTFVN